MNLKELELKVEVVTNIDLVCPVKYRKEVLDWIYANEGATRRTGPKVNDYKADTTKFHVIGHVAGTWTQEQIVEALNAQRRDA